MKLGKIAVSVLSAALAFTMLAGCGSGDSSSKADTSAAQNESKGDPDGMKEKFNVKTMGRTYFKDGTLWLGLSGSGMDLDFTGDKLTIGMIGNPAGADGQPRCALYVDGERKDDQLIQSEGTKFEVTGKGSEPVNVKVIKLSECAHSCMGIVSLDAGDGTVTPAADKPHKIEFVGDSITCGYGVDDEDKDHHFSTATEDCTRAYAYKTAQKLDADYSLVSYSGWGIISGYSSNGKKVASQQLPKYYDKYGYTFNMGFGTEKPENLDWDFSKFVPDAVVINLGTNDASYAKKKDQKQEYHDAYIAFLKTVREKNPTAKIYCTLGIMDSNLNKYVVSAAQDYTKETGDTNIASFEFPMQDMQNDGLVADWHPTEKTHEKESDLLAEFIKKDMGW